MSESKSNQPKNQKKTNNNRRKGGKFHNIRRRISRTAEEETAGGVVFRRGKDSIEILMIQDPKDRWSIPKGKVEKGEHLSATAEREIKEETGLKHLRVLDKLGKVDFRYRNKDTLISKTMHVFLVHAYRDSDDYRPEEHEAIKDVAWFPVSKALNLIEYDDIGKLFLIALKKIRHGGY
ncbi:MAG: NUDIX domain-containing protein [Candidatus Saccharimonadales bacterium]